MNPAILTFLTFIAVVTACAGIYSIVSDLYLRDRSKVSQRVDDEFRKRMRNKAQKSMLFKDLRALTAETAGEEQKASLRQRFDGMVEQPTLKWHVYIFQHLAAQRRYRHDKPQPLHSFLIEIEKFIKGFGCDCKLLIIVTTGDPQSFQMSVAMIA